MGRGMHTRRQDLRHQKLSSEAVARNDVWARAESDRLDRMHGQPTDERWTA